MSQFDFGTINPTSTSGTDLSNLLDQSRDANHSNQKGPIRPSYVIPGMLWIDDSGNPWRVKFFDGVNDLQWAEIRPDTHLMKLCNLAQPLKDIATSADFADLINIPILDAIKVSSDDTTPGDLEAKILTGTGLALTTQNPGANETRTISQDYATQLEAEAGSTTDKPMNALRTKQAIDKIGVPAGILQDFAGTIVPSGFLPCDGAAVNRITFANLFTAIGTTWGIGDGSTTFNVPDLNRRTTIGSGGTGTIIIGNTVGNIGGVETHTLNIAEMPIHNHAPHVSASTFHGDFASGGLNGGRPTGAGTQLLAPQTGDTGGGNAHNIIQPSAIVLKIIKT